MLCITGQPLHPPIEFPFQTHHFPEAEIVHRNGSIRGRLFILPTEKSEILLLYATSMLPAAAVPMVVLESTNEEV
jgi:hypothetical protein